MLLLVPAMAVEVARDDFEGVVGGSTSSMRYHKGSVFRAVINAFECARSPWAALAA